MIDPRFANAGAVPLVPGYGAQQVPAQYQQHRHHHHHHKHKVRNDASPVSLDESIHKVDHSQPQYFQNDAAIQGAGYGVPYGAGAAFYPQQQQPYGAVNYGQGSYYQGASYAVPTGPTGKQHRRHHRHRRHGAEATAAAAATTADSAQAVPEQLIGQRSSSALGNEEQPLGASVVQEETAGVQTKHRRHHHHRHHHSSDHAGFGHTHQSRASQFHSSVGTDGYGRINDDLIFIERGEHSPHRQEPPAGYEYKGKIEVQNFDRELISQTQNQTATSRPTGSVGPCPPGWQQMVLTGGACGPCPSGGSAYSGQLVGGAGYGQAAVGGAGYGQAAVGGAGYGQTAVGGFGVGGFGVGGSLPANCQIVADYIFGSSSGGVVPSGGSSSGGQQQESRVTTRATIIEVWQKRAKTEHHHRSRSRSRERTRSPRPDFDFDRLRNEILAAIERGYPRVIPSTGTQTQPTTQVIERVKEAGEVRVIVQPIQPVFYMPRQNVTTPTGPSIIPTVAPPPAATAPQIVYVPRNVYVPVIKPVFVPRERIIVRPQVIHVARPVLVDRPVPVTQRPIIIDRERPIPVPVRSAAQGAKAGGSRIVREEYVYRDNLPVAYGGRCAEFAGGVNYGYLPTQQEHQYASSSTHETGSLYQAQGQAVNLNIPTQVQQSQTSSFAEVQQGYGGGAGSFDGSCTNLIEVGNVAAGAVNVGQLNQNVLQETFEQSAQVTGVPSYGGAQVEVLDTSVNPFWQKTDQPTLMRRYGRSAYQIVNQSKEVEQQMYNEIRQRSSSGGMVRSVSNASFDSACGPGVGGGFAQF